MSEAGRIGESLEEKPDRTIVSVWESLLVR